MMKTTASLRFGILGDLTVASDGGHLDAGPRLQRHLLVVLLVEAGRVVAVDRLVDLLWGDDPPGAALASLQAYVSQLRKVLEPERPARAPAQVLVTLDPGYALKIEPEQVDAWRFLGLVDEAHELLTRGAPEHAAEQLDIALGLWRGDPLAEFAREPWVVAMVSRLEEARDGALEDRIEAWLALGRHDRAIVKLEEMVQLRPLRERRWGQLIVASYRCGRQGDALRAYQRCRTVLADDLGIDPGPELRRLEQAVLAQDPALEWRAADRTRQSPSDLHVSPSVGDPSSGVPAEEVPTTAVARRAQLDRMRERVDRARDGRGGAVVLVGEPGVGKTTLAERATELAATTGATVAWGRCLDGAAPAYWPWLQLLRELPDGDAVGAARRRLAGDEGSVAEGSAARFHAYELVLAAFREVSTTGPLVVVIDDLHAADEASLALLQLVAGDLWRLAVLVVATLRDTERSPGLDQTLGVLLRHRGVERLAVPMLEPFEVERLAALGLGRQPMPEVATALFDRTGGNLFYLTELLRLLASEHRQQPLSAAEVTSVDVPSGIRDVLHRRVRLLPDNTQALLTLAAVGGRDVDLDVLERAARLDGEQLMLALEPAVAAGLLTANDSGWGYRFRHQLIQESVYTGIAHVEQARLHARVAAALEAVPVADTSDRRAQLAHHYVAAGPLGDPDKAVGYSRRAAEAAMRQGAWGEAMRHLEQALAALGATAHDPVATRCDVLTELGLARRAAGLVGEAHEALDEAIRVADALGDEERVLSAAVAFGTPSLWGSRGWGDVDRPLVEILERQLERLADHDDERKVRILTTLAIELHFDDDAPRGWAYANEAMTLGRRLGDPRALGIAACAYLRSAAVNGRIAEKNSLLRALLDDNKLRFAPEVEAVLRTNLLTERLRFGDLARFDTELGRMKDLVDDVLHSTELQGQLGLVEAGRYMIAGDLGAARAAGERAFQQMADVSSTWNEPSHIVLQLSLTLVSGALGTQADELADMLVDPPHASIPHLVAPAAALGFVERGDDERARELTRRWFSPPPHAWTWMQAVAYWGRVAAELGEPDPALLYELLLPHSGELALVGTGADCGGAVDSILAGLAIRLGRSEEARARAGAGLALERRAGARVWIPRSAALLEQAG